MNGPTQAMLDFATETSFEDLPQELVHESKRLLLDSIGVGIAGLESGKGRYGTELAKRFGGPPESAVLGTSYRVSCGSAAFANGELINALDFSAYSFPIQPAGAIIPAPLAVGETVGAPGKSLILAIALGYEISLRLAVSLRSLKRGFTDAEGSEVGKITGTKYPVSAVSTPIIGGAVGAGRVLNLDPQKMAHAVGLAAHYYPIPQTKWRYAIPFPMAKYVSTGWASLGEVTAVLLAEIGYTADTTPLDGEVGLWRYFGSDSWNPDALTDKLGSEWKMMGRVEYKPYPCWGDSHLALDCLIKIIEENDLFPEDIEWVKAQGTPSFNSPTHKSKDISDHLVAQFSLPYIISAAANRVSLAEWQDPKRLNDSRILDFMNKVFQEAHPDFARIQLEEPYSNMTTVEVKAKGQIFKEEGRVNRGFTMSDEELVEKFRANASKVLPQQKVEKAIAILLDLEEVENIKEVIAQVSL